MSNADKLIEVVAAALFVDGYADRLEWSAEHETVKADYFGHARAALSAIETAGWVLVPVEPTIKMCDAAMELAENPSRTGWRYVPKAPGDAWRMMLSARPRITGGTK